MRLWPLLEENLNFIGLSFYQLRLSVGLSGLEWKLLLLDKSLLSPTDGDRRFDPWEYWYDKESRTALDASADSVSAITNGFGAIYCSSYLRID